MFLDAPAKARLLFISAAIALVMSSTESVGSSSRGGQGLASSKAAAETVALFSSNLVAHWKFDEQGGTGVVDSSGHNNHGTLRNFPRNASPWVAGRIGGGLSFNTDGWTNSVVIIPDSASLNFTNGLSFTLAVWVRSQAHEIDTLLNSQLETEKLAIWIQSQAQQIDHARYYLQRHWHGGRAICRGRVRREVSILHASGNGQPFHCRDFAS